MKIVLINKSLNLNTEKKIEKIINTAIPDSNKGAGIEWSSGANAPELDYVFNKRNTFCGIALAWANCAVAD